MKFNLESFLADGMIATLLDESQCDYLYRTVNEGQNRLNWDTPKIAKITFILTNYCVALFEESKSINKVSKSYLNDAYYALRTINISLDDSKIAFQEIWAIDYVKAEDLYYFYLSALGLLSQNTIKVRLDLGNYKYSLEEFDKKDWAAKVLNNCIASLILLTRKKDGYIDIRLALESIEQLKKQQNEFEESYLSSVEEDLKIAKAYNLLGLYHLSKILVETATFLIEGYNYPRNLQKQIQTHADLARDSLQNNSRLKSLVTVFEMCAISLQKNSIWFQTEQLGSQVQALCEKLSQQKIIDLLPSQQQALDQNLLDAASNVTVVQMPTSAGKTLLAEFSILQTLALKADAKIVYVVPTRALVNQVLHDLKSDFNGMNLVIEKTSKVNEVDPSEDLFLRQPINILVSTPEKIDLLLRKDHPSVADISMVVVDEAHNIKDGERGARLELLLAILKRERPKAKFLLLSPFIPNAIQLTEWLAGGKSAIDPIKVDWKPADKFIMGIREENKKFILTTLPSAYNFESIKEESDIPIENTYNLLSKKSAKKERLFEFTAKHFSKTDRSILYLCYGKKTADEKAELLNNIVPNTQESELRNLVSKYIEEEIGEQTTLSKVIKKGIAVHHAGLTDDTRQLIEFLIKKNEISHICATTTVAQGINFPISTIFIDETRKGQSGRLSSNEFLNIAGRAGRTLVDNLGKIIFPFNSQNNIDIARMYLQAEASNISSALVDLLLKAEDIIQAFSEDNSAERAKMYEQNEALSSLVQYLIHLLNVADNGYYASKIEDLFKDSFGYFLLEPDQKSRFINICKTLYLDLNNKEKGTLKLADTTGFSVPSILKILNANKDNPEIANEQSWNPDYLFRYDNDYLEKKIGVIGQLREVDLGTNSRSSEFSPEAVAKVLIGWVNGERLNNISDNHPHFADKDAADKINDFISYLTNATFKSSWGLSALEAIVSNRNEDDKNDTSHIPSMVYYGVNTKDAVAMRMLGAPRDISKNLASLIYSGKEPKSYENLRKDIKGMTNADWDSVVPKKSRLSGKEWKIITEILTI